MFLGPSVVMAQGDAQIPSRNREVAYNTVLQVRVTLGTRGYLTASAQLGLGVAQRFDHFMWALNTGISLASGGLAAPDGRFSNLHLEGVLSPSVTLGFNEHRLTALSTFHQRNLTGVYNPYKFSLSHAQNIVFTLNGRLQRVGSHGIRVASVYIQSYNDVDLFLGDGKDRYWTGGASITVNIYDDFLTLGSDVYTGLTNHGLRRPQEPPKGRPFFYYVQRRAQQLLNMGQTYLQYQNSDDQWEVEVFHSGSWDMVFQNLIHQVVLSPWFESTTPNQWNVGFTYNQPI